MKLVECKWCGRRVRKLYGVREYPVCGSCLDARNVNGVLPRRRYHSEAANKGRR